MGYRTLIFLGGEGAGFDLGNKISEMAGWLPKRGAILPRFNFNPVPCTPPLTYYNGGREGGKGCVERAWRCKMVVGTFLVVM